MSMPLVPLSLRNRVRKFGHVVLRRTRFLTTYLYYCDLTGVQPAHMDAKYQIKCLQEDMLHLLHQVWPVSLAQAKSRLARGDVCFVCLIEGQVGHYAWVQSSGRHRILFAGRTVPIQDGDIWIYHCRTAEWARGRGIYSSVLRYILQKYCNEQFSSAWIYTTSRNVPSQKGILRAGFHLNKRYHALQIDKRYLPLSLATKGG